MKISPVKHTRDFYPEDMRLRQWIEDCWRRVSERAGFQPWDGPMLEHLDLYKRKSGDEIVGQLYTLTDGGGRELAIRPEMTPTLARMIAQRQAALPRPIKWYCVSRMCRYEKGQRGRLREFWQWNADVLGVDGPVADAEVISLALDGIEALGLTAEDVKVRINSRTLLASLLSGIGVAEEQHTAVYGVTDKLGKVAPDALKEMYGELQLPDVVLERLWSLVGCRSLDDVAAFAQTNSITGHEPSFEELTQLFTYLDALGKGPYCQFDIAIVRGLAYYTGPVFEIFDKRGRLRAICGGGRYDHLLQTMGGQAMPAVGFGFGDVVLGELLSDLGKQPPGNAGVEVHVIALEPSRIPDSMQLAQTLRQRGVRTDFAMRCGGLKKAMRRAGEAGVQTIVLVGGDEWARGMVLVRDMQTGAEREAPIDGLDIRIEQSGT